MYRSVLFWYYRNFVIEIKIFEGIYFFLLVYSLFHLTLCIFLINRVNSLHDTLLLFTVCTVEVLSKCVQANELAGKQEHGLSVDSSTAVSDLFNLGQVENAESK